MVDNEPLRRAAVAPRRFTQKPGERIERPTTLTDFLLARIAEDEHAAHCDEKYAVQHAHKTTSPARILAECDAKRRIVEDHEWDETPGSPVRHSRELRHLASIYADHPDYREEWKP